MNANSQFRGPVSDGAKVIAVNLEGDAQRAGFDKRGETADYRMYEVAGVYTAFYDACPVLKAEGEVRSSRLALCALTAESLKTGLGLLGITVPSRM